MTQQRTNEASLGHASRGSWVQILYSMLLSSASHVSYYPGASLEQMAGAPKRPGWASQQTDRRSHLSAFSIDEHVNEAAGGSQLLQPPEL